MINTIRMVRNDVARINGPARVEVKEGRILVAGATYTSGEFFIVHKYRSYGMLALEEAKLNVVLGEGAGIEKVSHKEEVVREWLRIAEKLMNDFQGLGKRMKVLVIGPIDSGKTTLTAFIANYFLEKGVKPSIIEADIGQEDLAIPGTVALRKVNNKFLWQRDLDFQSLRFVGCITPSKCSDRVITSVLDLIIEEGSAEIVIVNTDGWVNTPSALLHKLELVRWVKPTHIVVTDGAIYELLKENLRSCEVLYAEPPRNKVTRDREVRKQLRKESYTKYFAKGRVRLVDLASVELIGFMTLLGKRVSLDELAKLLPCIRNEDIRVLYATTYKEYLNMVVEESNQSLRACLLSRGQEFRVRVNTPQDFLGCLVGLVGKEGKDVGVGKIVDLRFYRNSVTLSILTPYEGVIQGLVGGQIKLKDDFQEVLGGSECNL